MLTVTTSTYGQQLSTAAHRLALAAESSPLRLLPLYVSNIVVMVP
jgi:hypothetical protein